MVQGIQQYSTPLKVDFIEWIENHLDCDCIISDNNDNDNLYILAYATSKEYNGALFRMVKQFPGAQYMRGMSSQEIKSID